MVTQAELCMVNSSKARLSGDLLNTTVVAVIEPGKNLMAKSAGCWTLDMSDVSRVSSAAVALLLEWLRAANEQQIELKIDNLPEHMRPMIDISDLQPLIYPLLNQP